MIKYYCKFFEPNTNDQVNSIVYAGEMMNSKFNNFNIKIDMSDFDVNHLDISEYKLTVEKKMNGTYIFFNSFVGQIDVVQKQILFNGILDKTDNTNVGYRFHLTFYSGGISIFEGSKYSFEITVKNECEDFYIEVDNSICIGDDVELQEDDEIENITFDVNVNNNSKNNTLMYWYDFGYEEDVKPKEFKVFGEKTKKFDYVISKPIFKNDFTYLHFYMKDSFNNIRYKKVKILTKKNVNELLEIISGDIYLNDLNHEFCLFYRSKNINEVKVKLYTITNNDSEENYVGKKTIGFRDLEDEFISINLSDHFDDIENILKKSKEIKMTFLLNSSEKESLNSINIFYDYSSPEIFLDLDDNYLLKKENVEYVKISGKVVDKNLFFIGGDIKKYDFNDVNNYCLIKSDIDITHIELNNGSKIKPIKLGKYYVASLNDKIYAIYHKTEKLTNVLMLDDFCSKDEKVLFVNIDKKKLNTYEKNLLDNNLLLLKGDIEGHIVSQNTYDIGNHYLIKAIVNAEFTDNVKFDIGISEFNYSFLKYIDDNSVSCELRRNKTLNMDFDSSRLVFIKTNKPIQFQKFSKDEMLTSKSSIIIDDVSFVPISLSNSSFFTCKQSHIFFDDVLNNKPVDNVFTYPTITSNDINIEFKNYKMSKIEKEIFSFEFDVQVKFGVNELKITFEDILKNKQSKDFIIEIQDKDVEVIIDESYLEDAIITEEKDYKVLNTKKESLTVKLIIKNQTHMQRQSEKFLILSSGRGNSKYKIINEKNVSYCYIDLYNYNEKNCDVFYDSINSDVKLNIKLNKIDFLKLDCPSETITGMTNYYIPLKKDNFSLLTIEHTNAEKITCEYVEKDGNSFIQVNRLDNKNFIEESYINIKAFDNKNIFNGISKDISITFYNDTLIADAYIQPQFIINDEIFSNSINIEIKTFEKEYIDTISYYDLLELDFYKRKKKAEYKGDGIYVIKNIITPIVPTPIDVEISLKTKKQIVITKRLFNDAFISLKENEEDVSLAYEMNNSKLDIVIKNKGKKSLNIKSAFLLLDGKITKEYKDIKIDSTKTHTIELPIKQLYGHKQISFKIINEYGTKIIFPDELVNIKRNISSCAIKGFGKYNLLDVSESNIIDIIKEDDNIDLSLIIVDLYGIKTKYNVNDGINNINHLEPGLYEYYLVDDSTGTEIVNYHVEISHDKTSLIQSKNNGYLKYDFVKDIVLENLSSIPMEELDPKLLYYLNDNFIKVCTPNWINERNMQFTIDKKHELNKYVYKDSFIEKTLPIVKISKPDNLKSKVYNFNTKDESAFYIKDNCVNVERQVPVYFTAENLKYMKILSKPINRWFTKSIINDEENMIPFAFIPCEVKFFNVNNEEVKELKLDINISKGA